MSFSNARIVGVGISPEDYLRQEVERGHPDYVLSRSDLVEIAKCPRRWRDGYQPAKETDATDRGSLWDCLLLDGEAFGTRYAIIPATYPAPSHHPKVKKGEIAEGDPLPWNANAGWCEQWLADHQKFETVKTPELEEAKQAVEAVQATPELADVIRVSQKQMMVVGTWTDEATGVQVPLRALVDIVPDKRGPLGDCLIDYKTTVSAEIRAWNNTVNKFHHHTQAALHLDLYNAASGEARGGFRHIVQESAAPFHVEKRLLSDEFLKLGRSVYMAGLLAYCQGIKHDDWPGYYAPTVLHGWQLSEPEAYMI